MAAAAAADGGTDAQLARAICDRLRAHLKRKGKKSILGAKFMEDVVLQEERPRVGKLKKFLAKHPHLFHLESPGGVFMVACAVRRSSSHAQSRDVTEHRGPFTLITDAVQTRTACEALSSAPMIALDCEGVNLGRHPGGGLCLIQLASSPDNAFLFDVRDPANLAAFLDAGLRGLLEGAPVKVIHDCRMDAAALKANGVCLKNVLDTQVAYQMLCQTDALIGLDGFLRFAINERHPLKAEAPHVVDPEFWAKEFTHKALLYASADVSLLYKAACVLDGLFQQKPDTLVRSLMLRSHARALSSTADDRSPFLERCQAAARELERTLPGQFHPVVMCQTEEYLAVLPPRVREALVGGLDVEKDMVDVVMDLGRPLRVILQGHPSILFGDLVVDDEMIDHVKQQVGRVTDANRACVKDTLHRCSFVRDPDFEDRYVGLTLRFARVLSGLAGVVEDIVGTGGRSVLLVGPPGAGKTTLLRDIARLCSSETYDRRVMIVDTNNEIAGEDIVPHEAIGDARRMKVGPRAMQYRRMLEAVQNHTPDMLIIDEIGTPQEVVEAVGISQRGVQLIATTHGRSLKDIIENPQLKNLVGGISAVILSAQEKESAGAKAKTRLERRGPPAFDVCIELLERGRLRIHHDVSGAVDCVLRDLGERVPCEVRAVSVHDSSIRSSTELFPLPDEGPVSIRLDPEDLTF